MPSSPPPIVQTFVSAFNELPRPILIVNALVFAAAIAEIFRSGNVEFAFYVGSLVPIIAVVLYLNSRVPIGNAALWGLTLWAAAHMAGGLVSIPSDWPYQGDQAVLYSWWLIPGFLKYDNVVHAWGFATSTLVCYRCVAGVLGRHANHIGILLLCGLAGCGLGSINEIIEFIATRISPDTNVGGYVNTALDLVFNLLGSGTMVAALAWRTRRSELTA